MIYIYITEDNRLGFDIEPPTDDDALCVNNGTLTVLRVSDSKVEEMHGDAEWQPLPQSDIIVACGSEFHDVP